MYQGSDFPHLTVLILLSSAQKAGWSFGVHSWEPHLGVRREAPRAQTEYEGKASEVLEKPVYVAGIQLNENSLSPGFNSELVCPDTV